MHRDRRETLPCAKRRPPRCGCRARSLVCVAVLASEHARAITMDQPHVITL